MLAYHQSDRSQQIRRKLGAEFLRWLKQDLGLTVVFVPLSGYWFCQGLATILIWLLPPLAQPPQVFTEVTLPLALAASLLATSRTGWAWLLLAGLAGVGVGILVWTYPALPRRLLAIDGVRHSLYFWLYMGLLGNYLWHFGWQDSMILLAPLVRVLALLPGVVLWAAGLGWLAAMIYAPLLLLGLGRWLLTTITETRG